MDKEWMSIGELAKLMKVSVRTLQYYDKQGLLSPSAMSEGGRRLYHAKDVVKLHQILSFKYLGFSLEEIRDRILPLDTTEEIAAALQQQKRAVCEEISRLQSALKAIDALRKEVLCMQEVDFKKYAVIVELLRMEKKEYWVWKFMDTTLTDHIQQRFMEQPEYGDRILHSYHRLADQAYEMKMANVDPTSQAAMELAQKWWEMVDDFTGGDSSLLSNLEKFNQNREGWDKQMADRQDAIDDYLQDVFLAYAQFVSQTPEMEGKEPWKQSQ